MIQYFAKKAREEFHGVRARLLMELMSPKAGMRVLDVGSGWGDPLIRRVADKVPLDVTLADISEGPLHDAARLGFHSVLLEENKPLPFDDGAFDIVVSNSVIEHVTASKAICLDETVSQQDWLELARASQRAFAEEIRRVGKQYFVQTPHRDFPFDLHLWMPFTNWLPHSATRRIVKFSDRYWVKHNGVADWNLLDTRDMQTLFPDATIHVEKLFGLPKSIIAFKRVDA
jgi:hypothetical protein